MRVKTPVFHAEAGVFFMNPSPRLREAFASAGKPGLPSGRPFKISYSHLMGERDIL
jgi:hypothetical protein